MYSCEDKTIVSWNIDSIRCGIVDGKTAACKNKKREILESSPMGKLLKQVDPDIICLQETKISPQHAECFSPAGYHTYWNSSTGRKGYSGVSIWTKERPNRVTAELPGIGEDLQNEGRILTAFFDNLVVVTVYVPNTLRAGTKPLGGWSSVRDEEKRVERESTYNHFMRSRAQWDNALLDYLILLKNEFENVLLCGDMNVARSLKDLHNGDFTKIKLENAKKYKQSPARIHTLEKRLADAQLSNQRGGGAGFRSEEREAFERLFSEAGYVDAFRHLYPDSFGFTFWDRTKWGFRKANNGWRIDYFVLTPSLIKCVADIEVLSDLGVVEEKVPSDHAPLVLVMRQK